MPERRRYPRIQCSAVAFISWKTFDGQRNHVLGRCLDVSERGLGLHLSTRIPVGSFVRVKAYRLKLDGSATVRRVLREAGGYILGLELSEPMDSDVLADLSAPRTEAVAATSVAQGR